MFIFHINLSLISLPQDHNICIQCNNPKVSWECIDKPVLQAIRRQFALSVAQTFPCLYFLGHIILNYTSHVGRLGPCLTGEQDSSILKVL